MAISHALLNMTRRPSKSLKSRFGLPPNISFPKVGSINSLSRLDDFYYEVKHNIPAYDPAVEILHITNRIRNLGNNAIDYVFNNLEDYINIIRLYKRENWMKVVVAKQYSDAYFILFAINVLKERRGEEFNYPAVLSRKLITLKDSISMYINAVNEHEANMAQELFKNYSTATVYTESVVDALENGAVVDFKTAVR